MCFFGYVLLKALEAGECENYILIHIYFCVCCNRIHQKCLCLALGHNAYRKTPTQLRASLPSTDGNSAMEINGICCRFCQHTCLQLVQHHVFIKKGKNLPHRERICLAQVRDYFFHLSFGGDRHVRVYTYIVDVRVKCTKPFNVEAAEQ